MPFVTGNPEIDFFEQNPELVIIGVFKNLIDDVGKDVASKIMWCTHMMEDPKSKIFNIPRDERIKEIVENHYKDYDPKAHEDVASHYRKYCLEKEEVLYKIQVKKLDQLTASLDILDIDKDKDFTKYMRIMDKLPKIWDGLEKVKKRMIEKQSKAGLRGGAQRSRRESR